MEYARLLKMANVCRTAYCDARDAGASKEEAEKIGAQKADEAGAEWDRTHKGKDAEAEEIAFAHG
jgi:hypothetical protein